MQSADLMSNPMNIMSFIVLLTGVGGVVIGWVIGFLMSQYQAQKAMDELSEAYQHLISGLIDEDEV